MAVQQTIGRTNKAVKSPLAMMPGVQFQVGTMRGRLMAMEALLAEYTENVLKPEGGDLAGFVAKTCVPKYFIANEAQEVVKIALEVIGGSGVRNNSRISQIAGDIRAGTLVPFNNDLCREVIGKTALGIDPTSTPRWL